MPYELLNVAQVTPPRLHALVRLIASIGPSPRTKILDLLQPQILTDNQNSAENVLRAAKECQLVADVGGQVQLAVGREQVEAPTAFRLHLQRAVLGVTDESRPNYLFNLYTAWYFSQGDTVLTYSRGEFATQFNSDLSARDEDRVFNQQKFPGWLQWAAYLQLGWQMRQPGAGTRSEVLIPDVSARVESLLPELLDASARQPTPFGAFAKRLAAHCPELDGGKLFELCWQAARPGMSHGNRLSLALSTGLRVLDQAGVIELVNQADARDTWSLASAQGHELKALTHIRRR